MSGKANVHPALPRNFPKSSSKRQPKNQLTALTRSVAHNLFYPPRGATISKNDGQIYIGTNTYGGTYYLDYSTLTVNATLPIQNKSMADFNGDRTTDIAAAHTITNQFFTDYSGNLGQYGWGGPDSMPLIWDYNSDGLTEVPVYHLPTNQWFVKGYPGNNLGQFGWGQEDGIPVPGDYNGDGIMERAFYHTPSNTFFIEEQGGVTQIHFGWNGAECIPVPGDYDGDGKTDLMIYHLPTNQWLMYGVGNLGQYGDCIPVPADYDGDGSTDIAVYYYPTNQWFVKGYPGDNLGQYGWGGTESFPIPGDYNGDGVTERGFYRQAENRWFIEGQADFVWGWGGADFMGLSGFPKALSGYFVQGFYSNDDLHLIGC